MLWCRLRSLWLCSLCAFASCGAKPARPELPNVVVIVVDTLRADHVGTAGGRASTPNLDQLANEGVSFPFAFTHAPLTLPAHAALFASRPPQETGVLHNGQTVRRDLPLFSEWLRKQGYASQATVSLATLWPNGHGQGLDRGFQRFEHGRASISRGAEVVRECEQRLDELAARQPFLLFAHFGDPHEPYDAHGAVRHAAQVLVDGEVVGTYRTSEWTQVDLELELGPGAHRLEVRSPVPFELRSLSFAGPYGDLPLRFEVGGLLAPLETAVAWIEVASEESVTGRLRLWIHDVPELPELAVRYRREVQYSDRCVGRLLALLQRRGLYADTLIVFTSDHGEALGERGIVGHGVNLYDELLHVPLIIKPPISARARNWLAERRDVLVRLEDVVPTILDLLDLDPLPGQQGVSLRETVERPLLAETHPPEAPRTLYALRDERSKLIFDPAADRFELYDLADDPLELRDVFASSGAAHAAGQALLRARATRRPMLGPDAASSQLDPELREPLRSLGY
jgi:sulfatase-like protein